MSVEMAVEPVTDRTIDSLFPSPGIIIKDLYEIFISNKLVRERNSAVLNYLNLLFSNNN